MKILVIYGSTTGTTEGVAEQIADKLGATAVNVADVTDEQIAGADNLILGSSTWGAGELQDDWYDGLEKLKAADLSGKTVAIFGVGDSASYSDTFSARWQRYIMRWRTAAHRLWAQFRLTATSLTTRHQSSTASLSAWLLTRTTRAIRRRRGSTPG